jgi:ferrochelatase
MSKTALVLIAHGTVEKLDDLPAFLQNIRRGHPAPPDVLAEVRRRYEAIGGKSPLTDISRSLAKKLEARLGIPVRLAMRLWHPYPKEVLTDLAKEGVERVAVVPLAQHSAKVYGASMEAAAAEIEKGGGSHLELACAENWGQNEKLIDAFTDVVGTALSQSGLRPDTPSSHASPLRSEDVRTSTPTVIFTAHSLPTMIVKQGDPYESEVRASAKAIAEKLHASIDTRVCFQSQGMGGGEWMGPDLKTTLEDIAKAARHLSAETAGGKKGVLIAPIGFLADHVEILYDLDIEAMGWAKDLGLSLTRTQSLNDGDALVAAVESVARPLIARLSHAAKEGGAKGP